MSYTERFYALRYYLTWGALLAPLLLAGFIFVVGRVLETKQEREQRKRWKKFDKDFNSRRNNTWR